MRIYQFEHESGVSVCITVDCENKISITAQNLGKQFENFFEAACVGDIAAFHESRVIYVKLIHFLKQVFSTEKDYKCGTDERLRRDLQEEYPMLYSYLEAVNV